MKFHYIASNPSGKVEEGDYDANTPLEVLTYLGTKGLRPISMRQVGQKRFGRAGQKMFGQKITVSDKVFLTKYLALMLRVGTDLFSAIDILIADFHKPVVRAVLIEIREGLEKGQPFYSTFAHYPQFFSPVFINLIKAGESSGSMDKVFEDLSITLEKEKDLKAQVKAAFVYPVILLALSFVILVFLVTFALPKIAGIFEGSFEPPLFSRVVFGVGNFLNRYIILVVPGILFLVIGGVIFLFKTQTGQRFSRTVMTRAPVVRRLVKKLSIQQFASTLSSLMRAGLPIVDSIEITADTVADRNVRAALMRVSREGISKGITVGDAFKREAVFPAAVTNLIAISEKAGHLDEILETLSKFYEKEVSAELKTVTAFIEPVLLLGIGGIVGLIALSIIVPIYQLVGQF